jgi:hypothetical protein
MPHLRIAMLGVAALGFVLPLAIARLSAQPHHHPPEHAAIHDLFYKSWMRPDAPNVSCCSDRDCAPAEARMKDGRWVARKYGETVWYSVPPERVELNRDSPDGRNHLCAMGEHVFCFIAAAGG